MSRRAESLLWLAQRATAILLAVFVLVHLATIIYAVRGGLSAGEILGRTRGSVGFAVFYGLFAVSAAVHGAIGLRGIAAEWLRLRGVALEVGAAAFGVLLAALGLRAVFAVVVA